MSKEKFDLTPIWVFLAGLALGLGAFWGSVTFIKSWQKSGIPDDNSAPVCVSVVPDNLPGYQFENWISTPQLEDVRDFSLDPDGKLFLILGKHLYFIGLTAPFSAEIELPEEIAGQKLGAITAVVWASGATLELPSVYLGTRSGVYRWAIPTENNEQDTTTADSETPSEEKHRALQSHVAPGDQSLEKQAASDSPQIENTNLSYASSFTEGFSEKSIITRMEFTHDQLVVADSGTGEQRVYNATSGKLIQTRSIPEKTDDPTDIPFSVKDGDGTLYILKVEINKILQMGVKP